MNEKFQGNQGKTISVEKEREDISHQERGDKTTKQDEKQKGDSEKSRKHFVAPTPTRSRGDKKLNYKVTQAALVETNWQF
jgi:hypothetical protein